ncbi:GntR family transcriptional regulator [Planococcus sp. S3-L1]|uniref:Transcriptional regulator n=1 Tax=Planococcus faecalis TaxID=1598147 RepID=A0ABM6IW26_9BACL|nr:MULTISPECIES: GntR family transcriptional regulator [Planococcus]AQU80787.1 transcriptional regulator [Planococcus faecalis]MDJ0332005.1 GntR family transcriptional regulator [Planococcus sp. S3-L1]
MSVNKETQILDELMEKITLKKFVAGEKLPSENELANWYGVPRMTVRAALTKLEERGFIFSKQGKGRFLKEKSTLIKLHLTGKVSFTEKMQQAGYDLKTRLIRCEEAPYEEKIYNLLECESTDKVYKVSRIRIIGGQPIAIHHSFVSEKIFSEIATEGPHIRSMFAYYRQHGYSEFVDSNTLLSISFPTSAEQQLLLCKSMVPLLLVENDCIDEKTGKVLEHTKILYRSDKFTYDITMN